MEQARIHVWYRKTRILGCIKTQGTYGVNGIRTLGMGYCLRTESR